MVEEQLEQGEIRAAEEELLAVLVEQPVADRVQPPVLESQYVATAHLGELRAAQQGLDPRQQLARAERLAQVVVGTQFQADHPVGLVGTGGEHDDRHAGQALVGANPATEAEAVLVRQHHVEDRQARLASPARQRFGHLAQRAVATARDQRRIAGRQRLLDDAPGVAVLPGYPHRQLPPGLALCRDRGTNLFVARLLAVQDQQNLVLVHRTEPLVVALSLPIDRVSGTEVRRPVQAG